MSKSLEKLRLFASVPFVEAMEEGDTTKQKDGDEKAEG